MLLLDFRFPLMLERIFLSSELRQIVQRAGNLVAFTKNIPEIGAFLLKLVL